MAQKRPKNTKMLTVNIPAEMYEAFKKQCEGEGVKMSEVIKTFLRNYLDNNLEGNPDNLDREDALAKKLDGLVENKTREYLENNLALCLDEILAEKLDTNLAERVSTIEQTLEQFEENLKTLGNVQTNQESKIRELEKTLVSTDSFNKNVARVSLENTSGQNNSPTNEGEGTTETVEEKPAPTEDSQLELMDEMVKSLDLNGKTDKEISEIIARELIACGLKKDNYKLDKSYPSKWRRGNSIPKSNQATHYPAYLLWSKCQF